MVRLLAFTERNILIYLKNKFQIFFSILSSLIALSLYFLFLRNVYTSSIIQALEKLPILIKKGDILLLSDFLIISATISLSTITIPYTVLQTMIEDKEKKIDFDIISSPLKRSEIILGYFFSAVITGFFISSLFTIISFIYMINISSYTIDISVLLKIMCLNCISTLSSTALIMVFMSFTKRLATATAIYGFFSAIIGFVVGAYMPLSYFPKKVQQLFLLLPQTQLTHMYKNIYTKKLLSKIAEDDKSKIATNFMDKIKGEYSIKINFFNKPLDNTTILIYVTVFFLISLSLSIFIYSKKYKK